FVTPNVGRSVRGGGGNGSGTDRVCDAVAVDGSSTRKYGGTGLGLTISQKLIETMGGDVNFYSLGEGLGSTVTFSVPLYQDPLLISQPED
ncbi:MAG: hypothetical protein F6K41_38470, partial [Symploca sp. SIO3E6]|nr:hypothetical protein [Caldora sp. SIO3E6]